MLEEVAVRQPVGVSELARITQIPKSSVQRSLVTLKQAGWLRITDPQRAWWGVTMKALAIGLRGAGEQDLRSLAGPTIQRLAAETGETVLLGLRDGDDLLVIAREDSSHVVRVFIEIGERVPLRATSAGVAIMARLEPAEVEDILAREMTELVNGQVASPEQLRPEIAQAVAKGYAANISTWYRPHVTSIGTAIMNAEGKPIAGLTLSIPQVRFESLVEGNLAQLTIDAAEEIGQAIASA
ncbi:IclR family transcriptional regulator [Rhodococcus sp. T2V]|uniref:IclR family transcriptional regulator n=1 Tax=Rhodococcus sp. T2V TaxID=3034164 RepID=UPI0023E15C13|nr:IclR family transcriptional regulator [Rhodococcus sp. T2V]MDF3309637.1 IclR family transcriptional regulator [Rhodococcus sp. T2V]